MLGESTLYSGRRDETKGGWKFRHLYIARWASENRRCRECVHYCFKISADSSSLCLASSLIPSIFFWCSSEVESVRFFADIQQWSIGKKKCFVFLDWWRKIKVNHFLYNAIIEFLFPLAHIFIFEGTWYNSSMFVNLDCWQNFFWDVKPCLTDFVNNADYGCSTTPVCCSFGK